jgi:hypothetical protein
VACIMRHFLYRNVVTTYKASTIKKVCNILSQNNFFYIENIFIVCCRMLQSESLICGFSTAAVVGALSHTKAAFVRSL